MKQGWLRYNAKQAGLAWVATQFIVNVFSRHTIFYEFNA
jgi:hypothetical protein